MYQFFVNIALVECEVHWGRVGLALKCTLSVLESALESFQIEKDAIGPFTALRSFLENNQLPLCKLNTFQNRSISHPTKHYEDPIEGMGSTWSPAPWIGGLLTELKGLASYCKAETTFTFDFSFLHCQMLPLSIKNREIKSESGFSFAIASQSLSQ